MSPGPDFLGIGPPRCGTTTLHHVLRAHPEVWLPPLKELHYWDDQRHRGLVNRRAAGHATWIPRVVGRSMMRRPDAQRGDVRFLVRYFSGRRSDEWYRRLFADDRTTGEVTPRYSSLDAAIAREVDEALDRPKYVIVLRDPIERAWSECSKQLGRATGRNMADVPAEEIEPVVERIVSRAAGDYPTILEKWRSIAGDRLFVGFLEELRDDPEQFAGALSRHLGIDSPTLVSLLRSTLPRNSTAAHRGRVPDRWEHLIAERVHDANTMLAGEFPTAERWRERTSAVLRR